MSNQPSNETSNEEGALMINNTSASKQSEPAKNSTFATNTIASQGPFMSNNGLGAGRSLSQKTWTLINKNIKGIEE